MFPSIHFEFGAVRRRVNGVIFWRNTRILLEENRTLEEDVMVAFDLKDEKFEVKGFGSGSGLKYESGAENWTVRCRCGARDDDGERMVACDISYM